MLRFAAAVLAVAAIAPTPAEQGLARLSEALASPAAVNDDVLGARCGVLAKMAPHPAVLKIDTKHKCSGVLAYATTSSTRPGRAACCRTVGRFTPAKAGLRN
jgi:hypothetical protein